MLRSQLSTRSILILVSLVTAFVVFWFAIPQSLIDSDPWAYSLRAFEIQKNVDFGAGNVFDHRLGVVLPTALAYTFFGVSIHTTNIASLLSVILLQSTIWAALPNDRSRAIGLALVICSVPILKASIALYPDIISTAFMAASSLLLFKRHELIGSRFWLATPVFAAVFLFIAFLAKLSAYWVLPLWAIAAASDARLKQRKTISRFYFPAITTGAILGAVYLYFCQQTWGSAFARFEAIQSLSGAHLWANTGSTWVDVVTRLTGQIRTLLYREYSILPLLALASLLIIPKPLKGWAYYGLFCLLFFWLGTSSFSHWQPLPLLPRMLLPISPAIFILAAYLLSEIKFSLPGLNRNAGNAMMVVAFFALTLPSSYSWVNSVEADPVTANIVSPIKKRLTDKPRENLLVVSSDVRSPHSLAFYFQYNYPQNLQIQYFADVDAGGLGNKTVYIYMDKARAEFLKKSYGTRHFNQETMALELPTIGHSNGIYLFKVTDKQRLIRALASTPQKP